MKRIYEAEKEKRGVHLSVTGDLDFAIAIFGSMILKIAKAYVLEQELFMI